MSGKQRSKLIQQIKSKPWYRARWMGELVRGILIVLITLGIQNQIDRQKQARNELRRAHSVALQLHTIHDELQRNQGILRQERSIGLDRAAAAYLSRLPELCQYLDDPPLQFDKSDEDRTRFQKIVEEVSQVNNFIRSREDSKTLSIEMLGSKQGLLATDEIIYSHQADLIGFLTEPAPIWELPIPRFR